MADVAMQHLQDAMGALDARQAQRPVTITASIGVAGLWLLPRLASLHQKLPGIDVRVAANNKLLDLRDDSVDIAIRYCASGTESAGAIRLFGEELVPVAHPSLGLAGTRAEDVLAEQVLLEFDESSRPWLQWPDRLNALGLGTVKPRGVLHFNQYDQVIHAAGAGQGVALGRKALIEPMLRDGRLVVLGWGDLQQIGYAYWLIHAKERAREDVVRVARWIQQEAAAS